MGTWSIRKGRRASAAVFACPRAGLHPSLMLKWPHNNCAQINDSLAVRVEGNLSL